MPYPRRVVPVSAPAREMKGSVRESRHNCNAREADCLYPLNLLRMNLLEGVVPGWRTRSNDATSDILMNRLFSKAGLLKNDFRTGGTMRLAVYSSSAAPDAMNLMNSHAASFSLHDVVINGPSGFASM